MAPESADAAEEAGLATPNLRSAQRDDALPDEAGEGGDEPRDRTARGGRPRARTRPAGEGTRTRAPRTRRPAAEADAETDADDEDEPKESSRPMTSRRTRPEPTRVRGRARTRRRDVPRPVRRRTDKRMVITEIEDRDQIAVLEGRDLVEHYVTRTGARSMVGNIYVARVQNVLPGMEAAFLDIGRGRNGVLYAGEVNYDEEVEGGGKATRIEEALKSGQKVLVQVTKDPLGGKGARLTAQVSLPGRFVVFVPNQQVFGISRRLPDEERSRLRDILKPLRSGKNGIIARTAAEGATAEELEADLKRLEAEWEDVKKREKKAKPATVVYEEPELTVRVVRDVFTEGEFEEVVTDSKPVYEKVTDYLRSVAPELLDKVRLHEGPLPVMEEFHVAEQIRKALERKVWLESGGYVIIDRTEAMTVIDVNTGKHVGKTNLEETVTQTNIEAAEEIARQLRLRDIGGMIIVDFIDMLLERNRGKVIRAMKSALAKDRTRSQVFDISPLGLLEITRKKVSAGLVESFSETCPTCEGRGILLTHQI
ncbi:MAG: Rne/Rng family ribonuclease [Actinomycetota bacterium]